jgi:hypothetical protein
MSVTSSAAVRLRKWLAPALLMFRALSAGNRTGVISHRSAECATVAAALLLAHARWNTRLLLRVTWPWAVVCAAGGAASAAGAAAERAALLCPVGPGAAALARCARRLRSRSHAASELVMQDLPRCKALGIGQARFRNITRCHTPATVAIVLALLSLPQCYDFSNQTVPLPSVP